MIAATSMFSESLTQIIQQIAIYAVPLFLGIICHEVAHGYVSYLLGDPTAKNAGRLTLNPLKHLDLVGTLVFLITRMIGWAKPVPINPSYYQNPRKGIVLVSIAGPATNFVLAALFYFLYRGLAAVIMTSDPQLAGYVIYPIVNIAAAGTIINIILGIFNLIPIPPLDGSKVLAVILPPKMAAKYMKLERYGFIILILLVMTGVFEGFFRVILGTIYTWLF
ncbi:site-2 protease family protein [Desulfoplanes sp. PS50]